MNNLMEFSVVIEGKLEKYNEVLSKARCRTFYKGLNRNGGYITDEFANKLLSTISYTPVKGIYSQSSVDYTDHGKARDLGRVYGVVPAEPNLEWVDHLDEDGITRTYATVDVLLYTALYTEASQIVGKAQSMELYRPSIKGEWQIINGIKCYKYTDACFLGLQVLGEETKPCFEGSAFFSLYDELATVVNKLEQLNSNFQVQIAGGKTMFSEKFKLANYDLSDNEKYGLLWEGLNSQYNEENGWQVDYSIIDVFDDYVIARNIGEKIYEKIKYEKNDEENTITIGEKEEVFFEMVTKEEKESLNVLRKLNNNSLDVEEVFAERDSLKEEKLTLEQKSSELELKINEQANEISTLTTEKEEVQAQKEKFEAKVQELSTQKEELESFKKTVIDNEKKVVIDKYSETLGAEILSKYNDKLEEYTPEALEKELAFELVQSKPSLFSLDVNDVRVPKEKHDDLSEILAKYKK